MKVLLTLSLQKGLDLHHPPANTIKVLVALRLEKLVFVHHPPASP